MKIGFLPALALLFIGLKLGSVIDWSWWLVLLPLWGPVAMVVGGLLSMAMFAFGAAIIIAIFEKR